MRNKQNTTIYDYLTEQCEVSISIKNGHISGIQYKFNSGLISFMNIVEIHHFCCVNCGYTDSCVGHRWEDGTPLAKFTSFACKDCKRLCDNSYLKVYLILLHFKKRVRQNGFIRQQNLSACGAVQRMSRSGAKIIRYARNVEG